MYKPLDLSNSLQWPPPPSSVDYPLDGGTKLLISGKVREAACEVLFEQDMEEKSVATTILDSISQVIGT